jgi:hypothetical protein
MPYDQSKDYATRPEYDWYAEKGANEGEGLDSDKGFSTQGVNNNRSQMSGYYISLKYRVGWLFKFRSKRFSSYNDFKGQTDLNSSISKDLKRVFKIYKKGN